ncbi:MAG: family 31 glucosidase, partial [Oscillospiraceae bacterium]|nr:family 31 glucosidase [Oscillospiraceae bacterium]
DVEDSFMFGDKILVCPVSDYKQREKTVYLPQGAEWTDVWSGKKYDGGQYITVDAPLEKLPLFARDSFDASFITKAFDENY